MHSFAQLCNLICLVKICQNVGRFMQNSAKFLKKFVNFGKLLAIFLKNVILELCKGVYCVDVGESFQTHIYLQNLALIQPRTSPLKFVPGLQSAVLTTGAGVATVAMIASTALQKKIDSLD